MQHGFRHRPWLLAGLLCLLCLVSPGAASADTGHITIEPATQTVAAGSIATISVQMGAGVPVYGVEVHLSFDPTLLEVVDEDGAKSGVQVQPGTLFAGRQTFTLMNAADNATGTLDYVVTLMGEPHAVEQGGSIIIVRFRGRAGGQATVAIARAEAGDQAARLLEVITQDGSINVQGNGGTDTAATAATATPWATATRAASKAAPTLAPTATAAPGVSQPTPQQPADSPTATTAPPAPTAAEAGQAELAANVSESPTAGAAGSDSKPASALPSPGAEARVERSANRWPVLALATGLIGLIAVFGGLYLWLGGRRAGLARERLADTRPGPHREARRDDY